jgi:hypothetical protein
MRRVVCTAHTLGYFWALSVSRWGISFGGIIPSEPARLYLDQISLSGSQAMTQRYSKFKHAWGMWYAFDTVTGNSVSLKTRVRNDAVQKVSRSWPKLPANMRAAILALIRVTLNSNDS